MTRRPPVTVETYPDEASWLAARKVGHRVSATQVAQILGKSPYGTAWDVYAAHHGTGGAQPRNDAMARGLSQEKYVLMKHAEAAGFPIWAPWQLFGDNPQTRVLLVGPEPWMVASPDGFGLLQETPGTTTLPPREVGLRPMCEADDVVQGPRLLAGSLTPWLGVEAKTSDLPHLWGPAQPLPRWHNRYAAVVPVHYALQCYWLLAVSGLPAWDLVVELPRWELRSYRIHADATTQASLVAHVRAWRQRHLVEGVPPPLDATAACQQHLTRQYPGGGGERGATPEEAAHLMELATLRQFDRYSGARKDALHTLLAHSAGNTDTLRVGDTRVALTRYAAQTVPAHTVREHTRPARLFFRTARLERALSLSPMAPPQLGPMTTDEGEEE